VAGGGGWRQSSSAGRKLVNSWHIRGVLVWVGEAHPAEPPTTRSSPVAPLPDTQPDHLAPSASLATTLPSPDAERRQLTVMFCDLVDSTVLRTS
jgi:hypothetical protein